MTTIEIKIRRSDPYATSGKLTDAELHFTGGELDGLKLVGFAVWERRDRKGQTSRFPARQFTVVFEAQEGSRQTVTSQVTSGRRLGAASGNS